jgi:hypothetical protein
MLLPSLAKAPQASAAATSKQMLMQLAVVRTAWKADGLRFVLSRSAERKFNRIVV